jgi:hypothetical protein
MKKMDKEERIEKENKHRYINETKKPMWLLLLHQKNIFCIPKAKMTDNEIEHVSKLIT